MQLLRLNHVICIFHIVGITIITAIAISSREAVPAEGSPVRETLGG